MRKFSNQMPTKYSQELIELFQDFCAHHEKLYGFPPLTAQIYTYILFKSSKGGVTFDEIIERLNASKSSVSTILNFLLSNGKIEQFNKIDERKRFFRLNPHFITNHLDLVKEILIREENLTSRLKDLALKNEIEINAPMEKLDYYIAYLTQTKTSISTVIEKLKK